MSVTFYILDAPNQAIDCQYCDLKASDTDCLCHGTGKQEISTAPEFNMANVNARELLDAAKLYDGDLCGELDVKDTTTVHLLMRLQAMATLNRMNGSEYWADRMEDLIGLIGWARQNDYSVVSWA